MAPAAGHVAVVGAGLSGLTAALHLLGRGVRVTVLEADDHVGGRCATEDVAVPGAGVSVRCDTGATVLTLPWLADEALAAVGLTAADADPDWRVERVEPCYHATFADGRSLDVSSDPAAMDAEAARFVRAGAGGTGDGAGAAGNERADRVIAGLRELRGWLEAVHDEALPHFMDADFDRVADVARGPEKAAALARLARLGAFGSLGRSVGRRLPDADLARLFSFQALYAGMHPRDARAVYGCIAHMDTGLGVHYPVAARGGSGAGALPELLTAGVRAAGGEVITGFRVARLDCDGDRVRAVVRDDGTRLACDGVVATVDRHVLEGWVPGRSGARGAADAAARAARRWSPSAVVAHGAVPAEVAAAWPRRHHVISFGAEWDRTFDEICAPRGGRIMSDPSLLVTRPAVSAPDRVVRDAAGVAWEPVSVLAPAPNLESAAIGWDAVATHYVEELAGVLDGRGFPGLAAAWRVGRVDHPGTWAARGMGAGSPFGLAHLFRQTGPFRPRNLSPALPDGVVTAGSTTVPGVGVPTTMMSGALAASRFPDRGASRGQCGEDGTRRKGSER
ncbi:phytoene desaturase family protein [Corynebacterium sp. 335C]